MHGSGAWVHQPCRHLGSGDADVAWAFEAQHAVEHVGGNGQFGRPAPGGRPHACATRRRPPASTCSWRLRPGLARCGQMRSAKTCVRAGQCAAGGRPAASVRLQPCCWARRLRAAGRSRPLRDGARQHRRRRGPGRARDRLATRRPPLWEGSVAATIRPVLSTRRCKGAPPAPAFPGRGTSSVAARRFKVVWSGTRRLMPGKPTMEPTRPSACRQARRSTARDVSAVRMASGECQGWPPRLVRGSAAHPVIASSVNHTVRLPRWRRLAS